MSSSGLILDIVGVTLMFFDSPEIQGFVFPNLKKKKWGYGRLDIKNNKIALVLLIIGFLLQLISNFIPN